MSCIRSWLIEETRNVTESEVTKFCRGWTYDLLARRSSHERIFVYHTPTNVRPPSQQIIASKKNVLCDYPRSWLDMITRDVAGRKENAVKMRMVTDALLFFISKSLHQDVCSALYVREWDEEIHPPQTRKEGPWIYRDPIRNCWILLLFEDRWACDSFTSAFALMRVLMKERNVSNVINLGGRVLDVSVLDAKLRDTST